MKAMHALRRGGVLAGALLGLALTLCSCDDHDDRVTWPTPDLAVSQTDAPDPVAAGSNVTYTVTVTNSGTYVATQVTVTDYLPAGLAVVSTTPSQGSWSRVGDTGTWSVGSLAPRASATLAIEIQTVAVGTAANTASAACRERDRSPGNNSCTATTAVLPCTDLVALQSDAPDPVAAGSNVTYTLTAANLGPADATGVTVTDDLPPGLTVVSATPAQGTWSQVGDTGTWNVGALASGGSTTLALVIQAGASGPISNTITITGSEGDPSPGNNLYLEVTVVTPVTDLSVTQSDAPDPVTAGDNVTYTVTASNLGPSDATGVTVTDDLPPGLTVVSATPSQGSWSKVGDTGTWSVGDIAAGSSATLTVVVQTAAAGAISNNATVTGDQTDPNPANDVFLETTTVN